MYGPFCAATDTDATTYNFTAAGLGAITLTGIDDADGVAIFVGFFGEDGATNWSFSSATADGVALVEQNDTANSGSLVQAGIYRLVGVFPNSNNKILNAASLDITVTASEAVTGMATCVWAMKYADQIGNITGSPTGFVTDSSLLTMQVTLNLKANANGIMIICGTESAAQTNTFGLATERVDTATAEFSYSAASEIFTTNQTQPLDFTCDYSGTGDAAGATTGTR